MSFLPSRRSAVVALGAAVALASTGSRGVPALTLAGVLVLAGAGLVMGAPRRRTARHR